MALRFSVCVEMIFRDSPFLERLDRVKASGAPAYEFWRWADKDVPAIAERARRLDLACAGLVGSTGGPLVDPARRGDFLEGLRGALAVAGRLGATTLIVTTGQALEGVEPARQHDAIVAGLRAAAPIAAEAGVTLALEPLNTKVDHAGYYLDSTAEGLGIVDEVGSDSVKLLYDFYHAQVMEGNLTRTAVENLGKIAHLHLADNPGRHEPGTGEVNYRGVFRALEEAGYAGYVGLEFRPTGDHDRAVRETLALASP
ncbi:MAG TPA: TIM barrel protein [Chloroflexota bacterium]|jgi:hydroxypyruvate isomerase|nr:TIM barrel protein [Chloroflexota bacterium]